MASWCRQVNCGNCGINWVNCAVMCVKDDLKKTVLRPVLLPVKTTQFFRQVWCHRGVGRINWGNCGIPWLNCAVLCVWKTTWKGQFWDLRYCTVKTAQFTQFFPSGMMPSWCGQDKLRELWDPLIELRSSLCVKDDLERTVLRHALLPVKTAPFTQLFPPGMTSQCKIEQFNWECIGRLWFDERSDSLRCVAIFITRFFTAPSLTWTPTASL